MFHTRSQPKLQGKAGEVKDLGPVMVKVWEKHMNPHLLIHQKILVVLKGFSLSLQLCVIELWFLTLEYSELVIAECFLEMLSPIAPPPNMSLGPCCFDCLAVFIALRLCSFGRDSWRAQVWVCPSWSRCRWFNQHCFCLSEHLVWCVPTLQEWRCASVWPHWQRPHFDAFLLALKVWALLPEVP